MIQCLGLKKIRVTPDQNGRAAELLRSDEDRFSQFRGLHVETAYPGVVKAWRYHKAQTVCLTVVSGMAKVALYDGRPGSPTYGEVNDFAAGEHNPLLIQVPTGVYHGFKCIGDREAVVIGLAAEPHNYENPDKVLVDPHQNDIPFSWARKDGWRET